MSKKLFSELEMRQLERNANVRHVSEKSISYEPSFKVAAVLANLEGNTPQRIFIEAGFHLVTIGHEQPKRCLKRWRATYATYGETGLLEECRGKGSSCDLTGIPSFKHFLDELLFKFHAVTFSLHFSSLHFRLFHIVVD